VRDPVARGNRRTERQIACDCAGVESLGHAHLRRSPASLADLGPKRPSDRSGVTWLSRRTTATTNPSQPGEAERFFGTLKYEHDLFRGPIDDADALAVEVQRFRHVYNTLAKLSPTAPPRVAYLSGW
jgi:transposase InsO family protein